MTSCVGSHVSYGVSKVSIVFECPKTLIPHDDRDVFVDLYHQCGGDLFFFRGEVADFVTKFSLIIKIYSFISSQSVISLIQ